MKQLTVAPTELAAELDRLRAEHAQMEKRLTELDRHLSLTAAEQTERANLKKAKLRLKDDIPHISHQLRA